MDFTTPDTQKQKSHHSKLSKISLPSLLDDSSPSLASPHKKRHKKRVELKSPETGIKILIHAIEYKYHTKI
jgi:hypothetical protein